MLVASCSEETEQILGQKNHFRNITNYYGSLRYRIVDQFKLNTTEGQQEFQVVKRFPHYYLVNGIDTIRKEGWDESSFQTMPWSDTAMPFVSPIRIYDRTELLSLVSQEELVFQNTQWLISCGDSEYAFVSVGIVHCINIDNDATEERIVQASKPWYHFYIVYDSTETGWKMVGEIDLPDRGNYSEIDVTIAGYFGLRSISSGTGLCAEDYLYFCISGDTIMKCFEINKTIGSTWFSFEAKYSAHITSSSTTKKISERIIQVSHNIRMDLTPLDDSEVEILFHQENITYRLVGDDRLRFRPDKKLAGFDSACTKDETTFFPEYYMYCRLSELKTTGTQQQRFHLKNFEFDSSAFFR